ALARGSTASPTADDVGHAQAFVEFSRAQVWSLVRERMDSGRDAQDLRRLQDTVRVLTNGHREGWISTRDAVRRMHVVVRRVDELARTLELSGEIERRTVPTSGRPRDEIRLSAKDSP